MTSKIEASDEAPKCYSCLSAEERDKVVMTVKQQHLTLDSFFAGEPPPVHEDPRESVLEKAHRLGSLALGGAVDLIGWIPGLGSTTKGAVKVMHKVVKFGPLALYSSELVETLQLLVVMASRSGMARGGSTNGEVPEEPPVAASDKAIEVGELSVGLYYLLLEHRNRAALDPDAVLREHASCQEVQASLLDELVDCLPLASPIAYASNAAEAQRQLRLVSGSWELVLLEPQAGGANSTASKAKAKKGGFLCCVRAQESGDESPNPTNPAEDYLEPDTTDPAEVRLLPPGRLLHLARHCGARRAWWIRRDHPVLHRIQVHHGLGQDHSGDSYREGLQEALVAAHGSRPANWAPVDEAATCACCNADFLWSSMLRSEPHKLAARCRCHSCGAVVCVGCSEHKQALPQVGILREVRVCDRCFLQPKGLKPT